MRIKKSGPKQYLQIVETNRVNGKTVQRVITTLGRLDKLKEREHLDSLLASAAKYSDCQGTPSFPQLGDAHFPAPCQGVSVAKTGQASRSHAVL